MPYTNQQLNNFILRITHLWLNQFHAIHLPYTLNIVPLEPNFKYLLQFIFYLLLKDNIIEIAEGETYPYDFPEFTRSLQMDLNIISLPKMPLPFLLFINDPADYLRFLKVLHETPDKIEEESLWI